MSQMHRPRYGEKVWHFHAFFEHHLAKSPCSHQPGSSLNQVLLGFYEDFITQAWLFKLLADMVIEFSLQPLSFVPYR